MKCRKIYLNWQTASNLMEKLVRYRTMSKKDTLKNQGYPWKYCSIGGVIRVKLATGEDLAHLGELDQKYWTVLSCPVGELNFDNRTLSLIDSDADGRIRVNEVVDAASFLCSVIKDKDLILKGEDTLELDQIDTSCEQGKRLYDSARTILDNLGAAPDRISVSQALDSAAIFKGSKFNGDGVVTAESCENDAQRAVVQACVQTLGGVADRSGEMGVDEAMLGGFLSECAEFVSRSEELSADKALIFPYGDDTAEAYALCNALKDKISDFYTRCSLLRYDKAAAQGVSISVDDISRIAECPIAHPDEDSLLPYDAVNPAWEDKFSRLRAIALDKDFPKAKALSEEQWKSVLAKFGRYEAFLGEDRGSRVASLGEDNIRAILASDPRESVMALIGRDKALAQEASDIDNVKKLMLLYRDLSRLLDNYLIFDDFYKRDPERRATFEQGRLYIDQRCCDLCIKVSDMSQHADMAKLSGMFLIYCKCTSKSLGKTMDIVAVLTDGEISELRPGKNGVFCDLAGNEWDATVTKVVDNPISIRQAFWSPYRKFWEFCVSLINKSASDKDAKMMADMQAKAKEASAAPGAAAASTAEKGKQAFDIAKFAGIFAALGMAFGYIGSFLTKLAAGIASTPWWQLIVGIAVVMLIISGPSCFLAWSKLRRRNLGPVLNANGWAINSKVLVNIIFGSRLTSVARYPKLRLSDPNARKSSAGKWILAFLILAAAVYVTLYFTGVIKF